MSFGHDDEELSNYTRYIDTSAGNPGVSYMYLRESRLHLSKSFVRLITSVRVDRLFILNTQSIHGRE